MAISSLYPFNPISTRSSSAHCLYLHLNHPQIGTRITTFRTYVVSSHSNPKLIKTNRRSRFGQILLPYDDDDDELYEEDEDDEDAVDDLFSDDDFSDEEEDSDDIHKPKLNSLESTNGLQGGLKETDKGFRRTPVTTDAQSDIRSSKKILEKRSSSASYDRKRKVTGSSMKNRFKQLAEELDLDERSFELLDYLTTFGLKESHFVQMYERHMPSLQINMGSAKERVDYLLSIGVKQKDIRKILQRQPQILQYTVENNLKAHVAFLTSIGIPDSRIGQIITATPSLFSYSVENSLKPTVRYLLEEVGIKRSDLSKVVQLSPQILVQKIENTWNTRLNFFAKELRAPRDNIVKMVSKHPQLLHYSIEDGLLPRINFLRSIGMRNADILKVSTSLTQVYSLSLERNLKPKYMYLVNELRNEVKSLTKYPTYLSLSLDQRIRPRHMFLVSLKKAPKGPFPLGSFVKTDECFCEQLAGTSVDKYLDFRQTLLLKDFARKYERR